MNFPPSKTGISTAIYWRKKSADSPSFAELKAERAITAIENVELNAGVFNYDRKLVFRLDVVQINHRSVNTGGSNLAVIYSAVDNRKQVLEH